MHPTAARELPADQAAWSFEPKWDGYRALSHVVAGGLALRSRNGSTWPPGSPSRGQAAPQPLPARQADRSWLKVKHYQRETFLVGGYLPDPDQVRSLLVGLPDPGRPGRLWFCGRVDHGLVPAARRRVRELLAPLVVAASPFAEPAASLLGGRWTRPGPDDPAPVFVRPELAGEVSFLGWESGRLRHPAYNGLSRIL
jgi:ATP-dependent DNA ligase